ncbi:hypothetical protein H6G41_22255 [Tolypothrix sp. FACHB-123]|uniref:hypothetical protein n=1 Tax=Tolypothrix sp. FACHB-123 TaxID=2692868 RepID=UPI0016860CB2|nr:hypothetical protein [Tolypothrix sp. FACHB-123]MBD2357308.1 hypothetical protein [Tolypothrix sp. FACHB-123]
MLKAISLAIATLIIPLSGCTQSPVTSNNVDANNPANSQISPNNNQSTATNNVDAVDANNSGNSQTSPNNNQPPAITIERLGIGGIKLDMSEVEVIKILGNPVKVKNEFMPAIGKVRTLEYPGISVDLAENSPENQFTVYQIKATSAKYATIDGVKVGDKQSQVIKTYGNIDASPEGDITRLSYPIETPSPAGLNFTITKGEVTEILCFYVMN